MKNVSVSGILALKILLSCYIYKNRYNISKNDNKNVSVSVIAEQKCKRERVLQGWI